MTKLPMISKGILSLALLLGVMALSPLGDWDRMAAGVDFYQFWGMSKLQRDSGYQLGSPYLNEAGYQHRLEAVAAQPGNEMLRSAMQFRALPDPTATPFAYYALGLLPASYPRALAIYRMVLALSFAAGVFLLLPALSLPLRAGFVMLAAAAYDPFFTDVAVGNLTSLQLLGLAAAMALLRTPPPAAPPSSITCVLVPPLLVLVTLLKPTIAVTALLLGLSLLFRASRQGRRIALTSGLVSTLVMVLPPAVTFGTASVWLDWLRRITSANDRLVYQIAAGNSSSVAFLKGFFGLSVPFSIGLIVTLMLAPAGVCLALHWRRIGGLRGVAPLLKGTLADPQACAAIGVLALLALSPLVWNHYQVLALIPALWLTARAGAPLRWPAWMGWVSFFLYAGLIRRGYVALEQCCGLTFTALWYYLAGALAWAPLWLGTVWTVTARTPSALDPKREELSPS